MRAPVRLPIHKKQAFHGRNAHNVCFVHEKAPFYGRNAYHWSVQQELSGANNTIVATKIRQGGESDNLQFIGGKKQPFGSPDGVTAASGLFMIYSEYA